MPIILGAKGLLWDGAETNFDIKKSQMYDGDQICPQLRATLESMSDDVFLNNSDTAGPDFIRAQNEILNLDNRIFRHRDTISIYLSRPKSKLYLGRRSLRLEMKKIHSWVRAVENTLLNLQLKCHLAQGFKRWYTQHPHLSDSLLFKYIKVDSIRTKHPDTSIANNYEGTSQYHFQDSSFFDLSILADMRNDSAMEGTFYLGLANRRTSPLIRENDTLKFYTTAEFDDFCKNGGNNLSGIYKDTNYWRSMFWKRLGCREVSIPFNYVFDKNNKANYALLKITELGVGTYLDTMPWRQAQYYHRVDTIIGQDQKLIVRLLPGEGKILKVEIIPPASDISGDLRYSNQRKLVGYPIRGANGFLVFDSLRYHLTYHRLVRGSFGDTLRVFYRRSHPISGPHYYSNTENILWENEISVSDSFYINCNENEIYKTDCGFPSIVMRPNSSGNGSKVYIVYTCRYNQGLNIVETILDGDAPPGGINVPIPYSIASLEGQDLERWGTPMVNASANGNFYCWSDSSMGIGVGWKGPDEYCLSTRDYIYWNQPNEVHCLNPSMNSYSRLDNGENEAVLVWTEYEENFPMPFNSYIFYVILNIDETNNIRLRKFNINPQNYVVTNFPDSNKIQLSGFAQYINHQFPVVYRSIEIDTTQDFDRIAWVRDSEPIFYVVHQPTQNIWKQIIVAYITFGI